MNISISEIKIDGDVGNYKVINGKEDWLTDLSKINIFVGPNNSGKSRFMRSLLTSIKKTTPFRPKQVNVKNLAKEIKNFKSSVQELINEYSVIRNFEQSTEIGGTKEILEEIQSIDYFATNEPPFVNFITSSLDKLENIPLKQTSRVSHNGQTMDLSTYLEELKATTSELRTKLPKEEIPPLSLKTIYIPTLRGMRTFKTSSDIYGSRTIDDYFSGEEAKKPDEIFTGYTLYQDTRKLLLGDLPKRELVKNFERFLSDNFFEGQEIVLIPREIENQDDLHIKIGSEKEFPVQNLGEGIQQIIILMFPLFRDKDKSLAVFIEEPELYLHPGMQRVVLDTLLSKKDFKNHQFFLTTHSNHFLDLTLDKETISIFSFNKKGDTTESDSKFEIENLDGSKTSALKLLGVRNSSVFLTNCTIWVEGITDRYYFRRYLFLLQKSLKLKKSERIKEDTHYSFVEYAGNNINHWSFLDSESKPINVERLCGRLFLITDNDGEKTLERKTKLKEFLGDRYYCLKCREIENLLKKEILVDTLKAYERVEDLDYNDFSKRDYRDEPLGAFIEGKILKNKQRTGTYKLKSGTLSDKLGFCKKAISSMKTFDDLSLEAKKLTIRLFKFICENNDLSYQISLLEENN